MPFVDVERLPVLEPAPGFSGRFFHSAQMTFAYYEISAGAGLHSHHHEEEEVWHILEGDVEISLDGTANLVHAGQAVVVPSGELHGALALTTSRVIVVDHPVRTTVGGVDTGAQGSS